MGRHLRWLCTALFMLVLAVTSQAIFFKVAGTPLWTACRAPIQCAPARLLGMSCTRTQSMDGPHVQLLPVCYHAYADAYAADQPASQACLPASHPASQSAGCLLPRANHLLCTASPHCEPPCHLHLPPLAALPDGAHRADHSALQQEQKQHAASNMSAPAQRRVAFK